MRTWNLTKIVQFETELILEDWAHALLVNKPRTHLRNWRDQRPSNECDLDLSVTEEDGRVHYNLIWHDEAN